MQGILLSGLLLNQALFLPAHALTTPRASVRHPANAAPEALLLPRQAASASSNTDKAGHTLDGRFWTRWSAQGDGHWIQYDLGRVRTLAGVDIAWYKGSDLRYRFELQASADGVTFLPLLHAESSGSTRTREPYALPATRARWVRLIGHGNNMDAGTALTEAAWRVLP